MTDKWFDKDEKSPCAVGMFEPVPDYFYDKLQDYVKRCIESFTFSICAITGALLVIFAVLVYVLVVNQDSVADVRRTVFLLMMVAILFLGFDFALLKARKSERRKFDRVWKYKSMTYIRLSVVKFTKYTRGYGEHKHTYTKVTLEYAGKQFTLDHGDGDIFSVYRQCLQGTYCYCVRFDRNDYVFFDGQYLDGAS